MSRNLDNLGLLPELQERPSTSIITGIGPICGSTQAGLVPLEGLEPPRPRGQQILSLPRLPFRHRGKPGKSHNLPLLRRQP